MSYAVADRPLWVPSPDRVAGANITVFSHDAERRWGRSLPDYAAYMEQTPRFFPRLKITS